MYLQKHSLYHVRFHKNPMKCDQAGILGLGAGGLAPGLQYPQEAVKHLHYNIEQMHRRSRKHGKVIGNIWNYKTFDNYKGLCRQLMEKVFIWTFLQLGFHRFKRWEVLVMSSFVVTLFGIVYAGILLMAQLVTLLVKPPIRFMGLVMIVFYNAFMFSFGLGSRHY
ncbi:hypothetical protein [Dyadobacter aurulentus]|uniref:hypothetical protein n=1 Tax=Dyadobacter sp. UC 10 TaxID=2605428 RepID=UPI0011F2EB38|nr:hypothetical protein [Dyadobacter sp. UC 10]KAA0993371.1 hypothetical protein FXO21_25935 [Dyadobacter sp. UC 10]